MLKRYFLSIPMKFVLGCWCCASVLHRKVHISQCVVLGRSIARISCRSEEPAGEQRHHHSSHWNCKDFGWIGSAAIGVEKQAHFSDMTCLYRINVDLAIKKDTFGILRQRCLWLRNVWSYGTPGAEQPAFFWKPYRMGPPSYKLVYKPQKNHSYLPSTIEFRWI